MIVHSYDGLWNVGKRLYKIENWEVPGSPLYTQIAYFCTGLVIVAVLLGIFGLNGIDFFPVKYGALPYAFALFMTKVKYDGKRPDRYVRSVLRFYLYPHRICRYEVVKKPQKYVFDGELVCVIRKNRETKQMGKEE